VSCNAWQPAAACLDAHGAWAARIDMMLTRLRMCRAAFVGSAADVQKHANQAGFSEQDQTDLYNQAHAGKSQGRVGLGQSSLPKKVCGTRWQGTKKRLASDSDDDEDASDMRSLEIGKQVRWQP
jgi:hypothetical protein